MPKFDVYIFLKGVNPFKLRSGGRKVFRAIEADSVEHIKILFEEAKKQKAELKDYQIGEIKCVG